MILGSALQLRDYQTNAIDQVRDHLRAGAHRVLLVAPTGAGKTVIASAMIHAAQARGSRIVFLAHRRELITQCSAKLDQLGVDHGIIMASHPRWKPHLQVQVASVQTLARRLQCDPRDSRRLREPDLVFIDEAHHARARTYERILEAFPKACAVGLTATPWRIDGRGLGELFEQLVVAARVRELTEQGSLVPARGFTYQRPDLSQVRTSAGDYNLAQLDDAMGKVVLTGDLVAEYQAHAAGKRAVVFAVNVKHSRAIVEQFRAAGVQAEHVDDQTPETERDAVLARIRDGRTLVVSNVGILTEGWDCPAVEVAILARPTKSVALALQMMGRVLRPWPGKDCARIHDHAGVILEHGLPDDDRDYSLEGNKPPAPAPTRSCPQCFCVNPAGRKTCIECGAELASVQGQQQRQVVQVDGKRIEFGPGSDGIAEYMERQADAWEPDELALLAAATPEQKAAEYLLLQREARQRGFRPGWVGYRYREMFGAWPNFSNDFLAGVLPAEQHLVRELRRRSVA